MQTSDVGDLLDQAHRAACRAAPLIDPGILRSAVEAAVAVVLTPMARQMQQYLVWNAVMAQLLSEPGQQLPNAAALADLEQHAAEQLGWSPDGGGHLCRRFTQEPVTPATWLAEIRTKAPSLFARPA